MLRPYDYDSEIPHRDGSSPSQGVEEESSRPIKELVSEFLEQGRRLVRAEVQLARAEVRDAGGVVVLLKEIAAEKVSEWKEHAKEAVMQKTMDVKQRVDTPRGWSLLGAIIGAGVGAILMKKAFSVRQERSIGVGNGEFRYRGERYSTTVSPGMDGTVGLGTGTGIGMHSDSGTSIKDRAMEAVDRGTVLKGRATHWFDRALESQPLMLAVGSIALGVFASLILPVSNRERRLIEPAKSKVQESISRLGDQLGQKLQGQETGNVGSDRSDTLASPTGSRIPPVPPLDDLSTKIH